MSNFKYLVLLVLLVCISQSCRRPQTLFLEEYDKVQEIEFCAYFGRFCMQRYFERMCDTTLLKAKEFDLSAKKYLESYFGDLVPFVCSQPLENKYSDSIWLSKKSNQLFKHNDLNFDFIIKSVNSTNKTILVPIFHIVEYFSLCDHNCYSISLKLSILIIKNNEVVYMNYKECNTKTLRYFEFNEIDESADFLNIHTFVDVENMFYKTFNKALNPYFKRKK